jgi:hemoglobin-like flavoprotein
VNWLQSKSHMAVEGADSMDQDELAQTFNDSYERVMNTSVNGGGFFSAFYILLIGNSAEAASKFRDIDMEKQVRMLHASVSVLMASYYGTESQDEYLQKLAERHSKRGADVHPRLYSVWLDCLIETVRRFDSKFNDDVATAWRCVFSKGIEFMASRYE